MKSNLKFKRGEFITQNTCPDSFAIFGGDAYEPIVEGEGVDYSLICYHNPSHYAQNSEGKWVREDVFEYDLDNEETCEYTINACDMEYWRACTQEEIDTALRFLANKHLGWNDSTHKLRKLGVNEQIRFGQPAFTGAPGGNANRTSPIYNTPGIVNPNARGSAVSVRATITRIVNDNWEQKEPISAMDDKRRVFVVEQCNKLKWAFDTYGNSVVIYPSNGSQVPRRYDYGEDVMGHGINALMKGCDDWGFYECE